MERVKVVKTSKVLLPNSEHQNFTETKELIEEGDTLNGTYKSIKGLRRGKPFSYRVFVDENGNIIYSNNVKTMKETEVYLGADAGPTPTTIDMIPAETFKTSRIVGLLAGGVGAYIYCKKKGYTRKKLITHAVIGGLLGYGAVYLFDKSRDIEITPSK